MQILHMKGTDRKAASCVQGQPSGEATPPCKINLAGQRCAHEKADGAGVRVSRNRKGEHKTEKEPTEGKERKVKTMGEDVQSVAQARKRRRRKRKGTNKGNTCHTENKLDEK